MTNTRTKLSLTISAVSSPNLTVLKKLLTSAVGSAFILLGATGSAQAINFVVPSGLASVEGDSNNAAPFLFTSRVQQIFDTSEFTSLPETEFRITQISFRPDAVFGEAFSATIPDILISFSTTNKAVDALSTTFADNVGADATVVYSGLLSLSSEFTGPAGGPKDFDIVIDLQTPFLYNSNLGNLLLDVKNFSENSDIPVFDAQNVLGDSISRKWTDLDVNSPTSFLPDDGNPNNYFNSLGLVVKFTVEPVPEPLTILGSATALGFGAFFKRKLKSSESISKEIAKVG